MKYIMITVDSVNDIVEVLGDISKRAISQV